MVVVIVVFSNFDGEFLVVVAVLFGEFSPLSCLLGFTLLCWCGPQFPCFVGWSMLLLKW